jgi:hypothetical protein
MIRNILAAFGLAAIVAMIVMASPALGQSIDPRVTQANISTTICVKGYTATVRPPRAVMYRIKRRMMRAQHVTYRRIADHIIALELGGAGRDLENIMLQTFAASKRKDQLENATRRSVCAGRITLAAGQAKFHRIGPLP